MTGRPEGPEPDEPADGPADGGPRSGRARLRYRPRWRIGLGAAVVLGLAVLAVSAAVGALSGSARPLAPPSASAIRDGGSEVAGGATAEVGSTGGRPESAFVHVLGAVAAPGIYRIAEGSRVFDALAAAGGATADADLAAVNLARPIADGEQLYVPALGESPPAPASSSGGSGPAATGPAGPGGAGTGLVSVNSGDALELETLPGVGPALAQRIIDWREAHGGFSSIEELGDVAGIGEKTLAALRDLVTL